jgi:hypothetical protein
MKLKNPRNSKEADELYRKLFVPKPCPCCEPTEESKQDFLEFINSKKSSSNDNNK